VQKLADFHPTTELNWHTGMPMADIRNTKKQPTYMWITLSGRADCFSPYGEPIEEVKLLFLGLLLS